MDDTRQDMLPKEKSEKNVLIVLMRVIIGLFLLVFILIVLIIILLPLKEKVPYFVEFKTATENYVLVQKAGKEILGNKPLIHRELKGYVEARENINKIDEERRYTKIVRLKSSEDVYRSFYRSFQAKSALWDTKGFSRECDVKNISDVVYRPGTNQFISIVEYSIIDRYEDGTSNQLNFKVTIKYKFLDSKVSSKDLMLNPLGTHVVAYSVSSIKQGDKDEI